MTFSFHSCIFSFSLRSSWLANCLITVSADLPARVVTRNSCLVFNRFAPFPLVALRIPAFAKWFPSFSALPGCTGGFWCCCWPCAIAGVASVASGASNVSFSMSLYSSILHLLRTSMPPKKTSKLPENNIELIIKVRYSIKNRFCVPFRLRFFITSELVLSCWASPPSRSTSSSLGWPPITNLQALAQRFSQPVWKALRMAPRRWNPQRGSPAPSEPDELSAPSGATTQDNAGPGSPAPGFATACSAAPGNAASMCCKPRCTKFSCTRSSTRTSPRFGRHLYGGQPAKALKDLCCVFTLRSKPCCGSEPSHAYRRWSSEGYNAPHESFHASTSRLLRKTSPHSSEIRSQATS